MTKCTTSTTSFPRCKGREITASFDGGEITSDGGALLFRQLDREMGLTRAIARRLDDARASRRCQHRAETMLRQRVFGLALGYEDLRQRLRHHAR
ncbi:transposase [Halomonas sp. 18H]|uniref:transposase n=1 Tax=Halomonas almeriensis TaxID=308163 RepID=UPI00222FE98D|nr:MULTISPECIES: transposase [Halomonas]MCW4153814.1 transposase [Halomonas sp. 18H]MDN3553149.1 transposase [Halomonas almeriensis]